MTSVTGAFDTPAKTNRVKPIGGVSVRRQKSSNCRVEVRSGKRSLNWLPLVRLEFPPEAHNRVHFAAKSFDAWTSRV